MPANSGSFSFSQNPAYDFGYYRQSSLSHTVEVYMTRDADIFKLCKTDIS